MNRRDLLLCTVLSLAANAGIATAEETILTLRDLPGSPDRAFTQEAMDRLPQTHIATTTPWTDEKHDYSGVLLAEWLSLASQPVRTIRLVALNDYVVEAETSWLTEAGALLATRRNGEPMSVSDKGPVFLMFPFDERPELRHPNYLSRAVWHLQRIEILA